MTTRKGIFISHIHEEAKLGVVIKEWVADAFAGNAVNAFLSSDKQDIPAGRKWLDVIEQQLADAVVMVSILSPTSLARPWVNIELGAAWIKRLPIVPLCHSGQRADALPKPFSDFAALNLNDPNSARDLIGGVADALKLAHPKNLHFDAFLKQMRDAAAMGEVDRVIAFIDSSPAQELPKEQIAILQTLARSENSGHDELETGAVADMSGLNATQFKSHATKLLDAGLIKVSYWGADATTETRREVLIG
jgi:hypothetical protein